MKTILSFLESHPLISINRLEKLAGVPRNSIRKGSYISPKHIDPLKKILLQYGLSTNVDNLSTNEVIDITTNEAKSTNVVKDIDDITTNVVKKEVTPKEVTTNVVAVDTKRLETAREDLTKASPNRVDLSAFGI